MSTMEDSIEQAQIALECATRLEPGVRNDLGDFFLLNAYHAHLEQDPIERTWWLQQSFIWVIGTETSVQQKH